MRFALVFALVYPLYAKTRRRPNNIINVTEADCRLPADLGDYFFDVETKTCFPFKYTGCGGNKNNFARKSQCYLACRKYFNHCVGKDRSFGKCNRSHPSDCCNQKALSE
ncbi:unnamed protein product [Cylicocyclus nassatus]|uniref:BPTI/Kunitz inhibitor domain-containing protein n=1 Tax=Cylicocyclus nassatus TaxID=53992 RepID=A0AA36GVR4_CYLNA|nr:unnamed protein product [Cylicocyclus nassatus]